MTISGTGQNLIFLISQPRSGSTLLQRILGNHPAMHTTSEPWIMLPFAYSLRQHGHQADYMPNWAYDARQIFLESMQDGQEVYLQSLRRAGNTLYNHALQNTEKSHFLDKTPRYYLIFEELLQLYPNAKFIILMRNPLSVISSVWNTWIKESWLSFYNYRVDLLDAPDCLLSGIKLLEEKAHIVHYETVVENPEQAITSLLNFLDLPHIPDLHIYGEITQDQQWGFGDPTGVQQHQKPQSHLSDGWIKRLHDPQVWRISADYLAFLGTERLQKMGYDYRELDNIIQQHRPSYTQRISTVSLDYLLNTTKFERSPLEFHLMRYRRRWQTR